MKKFFEEKSLKWETVLHVKFIGSSSEDDEEIIPTYFHSRYRTELIEHSTLTHVEETFIEVNS